MKKERRINMWKLGILLIVALCAVSIAQAATAQETPFVITGYISNASGTECNNPNVNITNMATGESWAAENTSGSNCYLLVLATGTDLNAGDVLKFDVTSPDGKQAKNVEYTITSAEVNDGGMFNFNVTHEHTNTQTWYLTSNTKPTDAPTANDGLTHVRNNLMHKGSRTGTGAHFDLSSTEVAWFYADTGAENSIGFGEHSWEAYIRTEEIDGAEVGHNLTVEICKLANVTGDVTVIASHTQQLTAVGTGHLWSITCEDNATATQDFSTGDWLAVRLSWDCAADVLRIHYEAAAGSDSYIESPLSDPGYPIPELPTVILLGVGLLVITGYVALGRRRT